MKVLRLAIAIGVLLSLSCTVFAATDQGMKATVQPGPVLRSGMPASADVLVDGKMAMRIAAPAAGMTPMERAQIVADRLNQAFSQGLTWEDMRVNQIGKNWTLGAGDQTIATADTRSAKIMGMSPSRLASSWGNQTVVALGGEPSRIAMQLSPAKTAVAGSKQELSMMWSATPTKSVPLLSASSGASAGDVTVGGSAKNLKSVNSVVEYESTGDNGSMIRVFVPSSGTTTDKVTRVAGVGLVGVSSDMIPTTGMTMGTDMESMMTQNATAWNDSINSTLSQDNLPLHATSKVVPLYSSDQKEVIGAAQIVGSTKGLADTTQITVNTSGNMMMFKAAGTPAGASVNNVVVSALVFMPSTSTTTPTPTMTTPSTTPAPTETPAPSETTPTTPPESTPTTPGGAGSAGGTSSGTMPDNGY